MKYLIVMLLLAAPSFASAIPDSHITDIIKESNELVGEVRELRNEALNTGPTTMSVNANDFLSKLVGAIDKTENLIVDIQKLISTVNIDVARVTNQLIKNMESIQGDINIIAVSLSTSVNDIAATIQKIVPEFNNSTITLIAAVTDNINMLSKELQNSIEEFTSTGLLKIEILDARVGRLFLSFEDSSQSIVTSINELSLSGQRLLEALLEASVKQIEFIGEEIRISIAKITGSIDNGINMITGHIDSAGQIIVDILSEVKNLIIELTDTVEAVNKNVQNLYEDSIGYFNNLEFEVIPRVTYGTRENLAGLNATISMMVRNIDRNDNRHLLELNLENIDKAFNYSVLYGYRPTSMLVFKGGLMHSRLGMGVYFGSRYADNWDERDWIWEVGSELYGTDKDSMLDLVASFGRKNGLRLFTEFNDIGRSGFKNWRVGLGTGFTF